MRYFEKKITRPRWPRYILCLTTLHSIQFIRLRNDGDWLRRRSNIHSSSYIIIIIIIYHHYGVTCTSRGCVLNNYLILLFLFYCLFYGLTRCNIPTLSPQVSVQKMYRYPVGLPPRFSQSFTALLKPWPPPCSIIITRYMYPYYSKNI